MTQRKRKPIFVTAHAERRARERLGVALPSSVWQAIIAGIQQNAWPRRELQGGVVCYTVPVSAGEDALDLPVIYSPDTRRIVTVLNLVDPAEESE